MTKFKKFLLLLLCFTVFLQLGIYGEDTKEETPIKVKFQNDSDHSIAVHVLNNTMITSSQYLEPHMELEIKVAFGSRVRLDYKPKPRQTLLSQMGSLNELFRTVVIRNDGETVFIREKFSGQRVKVTGEKRIPKATISNPESERRKGRTGDPGKTQDKKKEGKEKEEKKQPEKKKD